MPLNNRSRPAVVAALSVAALLAGGLGLAGPAAADPVDLNEILYEGPINDMLMPVGEVLELVDPTSAEEQNGESEALTAPAGQDGPTELRPPNKLRVPTAMRTSSSNASPMANFVATDGDCGRVAFRSQTKKLDLTVGKPGRLSVAIQTERPCVLDVQVRPLGRDTGIGIGPAAWVRIAAPATFLWTVTGTKEIEDLLVASVRGGGRMFGVRLPDIIVRPAARR